MGTLIPPDRDAAVGPAASAVPTSAGREDIEHLVAPLVTDTPPVATMEPSAIAAAEASAPDCTGIVPPVVSDLQPVVREGRSNRRAPKCNICTLLDCTKATSLDSADLVVERSAASSYE